MAKTSLVIVESPTKAKTIVKFLGKDFVVKASNGHIRDLPSSAAEIPEDIKKQPWATLAVNTESNFEPLYVIPDKRKAQVKELKEALKNADTLYLATDEDREGESISWHLVEILKPKVPTKRLVFHEITKEAIKDALENTREIDENLVKAQETRRIIDRLFGYEVSPLLWKKVQPKLSAGRVQSVAIRLLVEREMERSKFVRSSYWGIAGTFLNHENAAFEAELISVGADKVAIGKDFDPNTGKLAKTGVIAFDQAGITALKDRIAKEQAVVTNIEQKPFSNNPPAPFVTSTLQQEASAKLKFAARYTMSVAQQLYENGFITYMRTDSATLSDQALNAARTLIKAEYGDEYLPPSPRTYTSKVKNAQEAHEAIRPAGESFTPPPQVKVALGTEAFRLYELIWKRTVGSQMKNAEGMNTSATVTLGTDPKTAAQFRATGKTILFPGYLKAYVEGAEDTDAELANREKFLPKLSQGEKVNTKELKPTEHTTQPPARFTEGTLIKELEKLGIGRPSTWASIVDLVLSRSYAFKKGQALVPTFTAIAVVNLLKKHFETLVDYEFTASLEDDLDSISRGEAENLSYLRNFYHGGKSAPGIDPKKAHPGLKPLVTRGIEEIDPRDVCGIPIGHRADGTLVEVRIGRYGPFLTDGTNRASLPPELSFDELTLEKAEEIITVASKAPEPIGTDPETGKAIFLKTGRFGPYLQLGEAEGEIKPKMASLLTGMKPEEVDFETALKLLSLPRTLGTSADHGGEEVIAANGRFGPYVKCGKETRSIPAAHATNVLNITVAEALELLKQPKTGRGRAAPKPPLKELGKHPDSGVEVKILDGRYGPYVTDGTTNASLPRGSSPDALTMEDAVTLLAARAQAEPKPKKTKRASKKKKTED